VLRFAADENFNRDIVRGLLRRKPDLDIVRVQDVGLAGADDPTVLEWAAVQRRVVITHDVSTLTKHAYDRVTAGRPMPGVFEVVCGASVGSAIDDLLLLAECSHEGEWEGQVRYLPL
jgi:predicted nuclease of predicted toxin-antitoxin system